MKNSLTVSTSVPNSLQDTTAKHTDYSREQDSLGQYSFPYMTALETDLSPLKSTYLRQRHIEQTSPDQSIYYDTEASVGETAVQDLSEPSDDEPSSDGSGEESGLFSAASSLKMSERAQEEEVDEFHDAREENPTLACALETQQALREEIECNPIILVANQLDHNILTLQFNRDAQGTRNLLKLRLDALDKDIEQTFYRLGNKGAARQLHNQLLARLETLDRCMAEGDENNQQAVDAFTELLLAIRDYESTFHKDSWLDKATIAFIGIENLLNSPLADKVKTWLPESQRQKGDVDLLNPEVITMDNVGRVQYHDHALSELISEIVARHADYILDQQHTSQMQALNLSDFPAPEQISDQEALITHLVHHQEERIYQFLEDTFVHQSHQADASSRCRGRELLIQLQQCQGDREAMLALINGMKGLQDYVSYEFQHHYFNLVTTSLREKTSTALRDNLSLTADQIAALRDDYQQLKNLATAMNPSPSDARFIALGHNIERVAHIPLHRVISSGTYKGEPIWFLDRDIPLDEVVRASRNTSTDPRATTIRELQAFIEHSEGDDIQAIRQHLVTKNELLTSQQEWALTLAQDNVVNTQAFESAMATAQQIERYRPPYQLIAEDITPMEQVNRAGRAVLMPNSQPLEQRLQSLNLEHQLALDGYDFKTEIYNLFRDIPSLYHNAQDTKTKAQEDAARLLEQYKAGTISTLTFMTNIMGTGLAVKDGFVRQLRETLTGAAALGQMSPATLRAMSGKFNQTISILASSAAATPKLLALFHETHARIAGEAQAQYFIEAVGDQKTDLTLDQLSDNERAAVRRLMAINHLLTASMCVPPLVEGALGVVQGGTGPLNLAWTAASTGAKLFATYLIGNKVNTMSGADVKLANTTLDILCDGTTVAARRQHLMARSADMLANVACRQSNLKTAVKIGVLYPFKALFKSVTNAFGDIRKGKPGAWVKMGVMLLRAAPVIAAPIVITVGLILFPGATLGALPAILWATWSWADYTVSKMGLVDIAALAMDKAMEFSRDPTINFTAMADQILTEGGEKQRCQQLAQNHAYAGLSCQHWEKFAEENSTRAKSIDAQIQNDVNSMDHQRLLQLASTLRHLDGLELRTASLQELRDNLPEEEAKNMPKTGQEHHLRAWALGLRERLLYELYASTGSDTLPEDDAQLLQQARQFNLERLRGLHLEALYLPHLPQAQNSDDNGEKEMDKVIRLTAGQIYLKTRQRMEVLLAQLMTSGLQSVYTSRAQASGKSIKADDTTQMRPEVFAQVLQKDAALSEAIRREFVDVIRSEILRSNTSGNALLRHKLSGNGVQDNDIDELLTAQAGD